MREADCNSADSSGMTDTFANPAWCQWDRRGPMEPPRLWSKHGHSDVVFAVVRFGSRADFETKVPEFSGRCNNGLVTATAKILPQHPQRHSASVSMIFLIFSEQ